MIHQAPKLSLALQYHQASQWEAAELLYQAILVDNPQNADDRHLLGLVALQIRNYELAVEQVFRATRLKRNVAAYHANLGVA